MTVIMAILAVGGVFAAGFAAWYTLWHRRLAASFERVPVGADRSALVVRREAELPGDGRR